MSKRFKLLCPEWQGGPSASVHGGSYWVAGELMGAAGPDAVVEAPVDELDESDDLDEQTPEAKGVRSLGLIVRHFEIANTILRTNRPSQLLVVGGTCGVEAAPVSYLNDFYAGDLAVLWFDAHADMNTPESSPSGNFHGMVLRTLLGDGPVELVERFSLPLRPAQVFLVGARDLDPAEAAFIAGSGIAIYPEVSRASGEELCRAIERAGLRRVYLHFDVDVINPEVFPDALMHAPGGPRFGELSSCLRMVTEAFEVVGVSVVEFRGQSEASRRLLMDMLREVGRGRADWIELLSCME